VDPARGRETFDQLMSRLAGRFTRVKPRRRHWCCRSVPGTGAEESATRRPKGTPAGGRLGFLP